MSLKPCPFCGGKVHAEEIGDDGEWIGTQVTCKNCKINIMFSNSDELDRVWNTRPLAAAPVAWRPVGSYICPASMSECEDKVDAIVGALEARCAELERERDRFGETLEQAYDLMDERKWGEAMNLVSKAMHYPKPTDAPTSFCCQGHAQGYGHSDDCPSGTGRKP